MSLLFPFTANALSATTANMIAGTAPYLVLLDGAADEHGNPTQGTKLTTLKELLGFTMPDEGGGKVQINADASLPPSGTGTGIKAPKGMKFKDVVALMEANNTATPIPPTMQKDDDGDSGTPDGNMTVTWYNGDIKPANIVTNLDQTLPICGGPYSLVISVDKVKAKTEYGYPDRERVYSTGTTSAIYRFTGKDQGICYIQPASMAVFSGTTYASAANSKYPYQSAANPGGYNPDKWQLGPFTGNYPSTQTGGGFKRDSGFPTTAFKGAKFSLIGSGDEQQLFRCSTSSTDVTLSGTSSKTLGANCTVTYKTTLTSKPTADITIKMEARSAIGGSDWADIDSYTIKASQIKLWATVKGTAQYKTDSNPQTNGTFPAANACAGSNLGSNTTPATAGSYFFERNELTNTPIANKPTTDKVIGGYFARDVDGTFMSEWGQLWTPTNTSPYTGSGFEADGAVWIRGGAYSVTQQFVVNTNVGGVDAVNPSDATVTVCP